jgi:tetratricopeptide (TPR) repeat protein
MSHKTNSRSIEARANPQQRDLCRRDTSKILALAQRWVRCLAPSLVVLFTLAVFLPALHNQFVNWDDNKNVLDNPHYRGLAGTHLRWMWTTFHMGHYAPLTWMTLGLDYLLWGMNPLGYHLTSLLLHAANGVVFYFVVLRILTLALPRLAGRGHELATSAGFAALVFAIHPLRVESVAWVTERRDVLSALFYLLTILVYLRAYAREAHGRRSYWLSVTLFGCALLSKSMAVSLPIVLLILDVYPLRRLGGSLGWWSEPARRVYVEKIPFVLLAAAASVLAFRAQSLLHSMAPLAQLSVPARLGVSVYGLSFYLWKMLVPWNLSPLYGRPVTVDPWATPFILSYGLVLAITAVALALRRRVPGLLAAWSAYVVVLLPVLGVVQIGPQIAADRYTYLASLGWAILAAAGLGSCWQTLSRSQRGRATALPLAGIATSVVVVLGVLTWSQAQVWHDSERLWTHALETGHDSAIARNNLGGELIRRGKLAEAIEHFQQALRIRPDADAYNNLGVVLIQQGRPAEAIEHFQQAVRIQPDNADAHNNLGVLLGQQGKGTPAEVIEHFQQAVRSKPDYPEAHYSWGVALLAQDKPAEAIEHFQRAAHIRPDYAEAHNDWGMVLARQGKLAEATEHFQQALRIQPDKADAHNNLGVVLDHQGKLAEAIDHFRQALRIQPDYAEARANLGRAVALQGRDR